MEKNSLIVRCASLESFEEVLHEEGRGCYPGLGLAFPRALGAAARAAARPHVATRLVTVLLQLYRDTGHPRPRAASAFLKNQHGTVFTLII